MDINALVQHHSAVDVGKAALEMSSNQAAEVCLDATYETMNKIFDGISKVKQNEYHESEEFKLLKLLASTTDPLDNITEENIVKILDSKITGTQEAISDFNKIVVQQKLLSNKKEAVLAAVSYVEAQKQELERILPTLLQARQIFMLHMTSKGPAAAE